MKSEFYSEEINNRVSEPYTYINNIDMLVSSDSVRDCEKKSLLVSCLNILSLSINDEESYKVLKHYCEIYEDEMIIKKLHLKLDTKADTYTSVIKERVKCSPIALNIKFGESDWILIIGIHCVGDVSKDIAICYDMDLNKVFTFNLASLLWMCNKDTRMIYR